ncbi:hypothetical protein EVAR_54809_1 [Eumeta japonica]|uniref:Uncharacterized protein n=1 Tax=Eumeta variegata TaxID=151549 RepID=A0A4C1Y1K1_EUMVA|nr:hypothetical protein EVAR_54809_1 [Eumeta japonica]
MFDHSITHAAPRPSSCGIAPSVVCAWCRVAWCFVCGLVASRSVCPTPLPTQILFRLFTTRRDPRAVRSSRRGILRGVLRERLATAEHSHGCHNGQQTTQGFSHEARSPRPPSGF